MTSYIIVDIPNDRRYPRFQYQALFKHLGLMNSHATPASRHKWRFTRRFDLDLFISVFSARLGRRTVLAIDKENYAQARNIANGNVGKGFFTMFL